MRGRADDTCCCCVYYSDSQTQLWDSLETHTQYTHHHVDGEIGRYCQCWEDETAYLLGGLETGRYTVQRRDCIPRGVLYFAASGLKKPESTSTLSRLNLKRLTLLAILAFCLDTENLLTWKCRWSKMVSIVQKAGKKKKKKKASVFVLVLEWNIRKIIFGSLPAHLAHWVKVGAIAI